MLIVNSMIASIFSVHSQCTLLFMIFITFVLFIFVIQLSSFYHDITVTAYGDRRQYSSFKTSTCCGASMPLASRLVGLLY